MSATASDERKFHEFEYEGWQRVYEGYDLAWTSLTTQTADALLDSVATGSDMRLLDVAAGTGNIAAEAVRRHAAVIALDFSEHMVERAQKKHPGLDVRQGDAEALPFGDATFDAVTMNFGLLHLSRPDIAMREALRVLRPGGRFGFTVWSPEQAVAFRIVLDAAATHGQAVDLPKGPDFFLFSDPGTAASALTQAGFEHPSSKTISMTWELDSPANIVGAFFEGTARTGAVLREQDDETRAQIAGAITSVVAERFITPDGVAIPMAAVLTSAARPA